MIGIKKGGVLNPLHSSILIYYKRSHVLYKFHLILLILPHLFKSFVFGTKRITGKFYQFKAVITFA